jgi:ribose 5-phosphate isomerase B
MTSQPRPVILGADHAGFHLKETILAHLKAQGMTVVDVGCFSAEVSVDYPAISALVAQQMEHTPNARGIIVCGSGVGVAIAANRFPFLRAVVAQNRLTATLSREHNDANVLCLGERLTTPTVALDLVDAWMSTPFAGDRHQHRVSQLGDLPTTHPG